MPCVITTAEGLLRKIDRVPFGVRQRILADTARALAGLRNLIATLRSHPDPDVQLVALDTFTSQE
jgi:hypothetical protein